MASDSVKMKKLRRMQTFDTRVANKKFLFSPAPEGPLTDRQWYQNPIQNEDYVDRLPKLAHMSSNTAVERLHLRHGSEAAATTEYATNIRKKMLEVNEKMKKETGRLRNAADSGWDISHRLDADHQHQSSMAVKSSLEHRRLMKSLGHTIKRKKSLPAFEEIHDYILNDQISPKFNSRKKQESTELLGKVPPAGRRDAENLTKWLKQMLINLDQQPPTQLSTLFKDAQKIYTICFEEIVKQVAVHCKQRGQLIDIVWKAYIGMLERALQLADLEQRLIADDYEKKKVDLHSVYMKKINSVLEDLSTQKELTEEMNSKNTSLQEQLMEREQTIQKQNGTLKTLQKHYEYTKERLLKALENKRIKAILAYNDSSVDSDDDEKSYVSHKPVPKKIVRKSQIYIDQELAKDPAMQDQADLNIYENKELKTEIKTFEEEQDVRFTQDDFHDASTDTSDLYETQETECQTWIEDCGCESIGEAQIASKNSKAFQTFKQFNAWLTVEDGVAEDPEIMVNSPDSAGITDTYKPPMIETDFEGKVGLYAVPEGEDEEQSGTTENDSLLTSISDEDQPEEFNPIENLLNQVDSDQITITVQEVADEFENYRKKSFNKIGDESSELSGAIRNELVYFADKVQDWLGKIQSNVDTMQEGQQQLQQKLIQKSFLNPQRSNQRVKSNRATPTSNLNPASPVNPNIRRGLKSPRGGQRMSTVMKPANSWGALHKHAGTVPPTGGTTGQLRNNDRRKTTLNPSFDFASAKITQFAEFNLSDRNRFSNRNIIEIEKPHVCNNIIELLRFKSPRNVKGGLNQKILAKRISTIYAEKARDKTINRSDLASFVYEYTSSKYGIQEVTDKMYQLLCKSCIKYSFNTRVQLFGYFMGLFNDKVDNSEVALYINCMNLLDKKLSNIGTDIPRRDYDFSIFVPFQRAAECAKTKLRKMFVSSYDPFLRQLKNLKQDDFTRRNKAGIVDVDQFMRLLLSFQKEFRAQQTEIARILFQAVDLNENDNLELNECQLLVRHLSQTDLKRFDILFDKYADLTGDSENEKAISLQSFTELVINQNVFSKLTVEKFLTVEHNHGLHGYFKDLNRNQTGIISIKQMEWRFQKSEKEFQLYAPILSALQEKLSNPEDLKVIWCTFKLMKKESKRVAVEAETQKWIPDLGFCDLLAGYTMTQDIPIQKAQTKTSTEFDKLEIKRSATTKPDTHSPSTIRRT